MFIVTLKFSSAKAKASQLMSLHNKWIEENFEKGFFLLTGSIKPGIGGVILAHGLSKEDLTVVINNDPFVQENVVVADILEITPNQSSTSLKFLVGDK